MTRRTVNRALLESTTDEIETFAKDIGVFIEDVEKDVAERCAQHWSSDAEQEYQRRHRNWRQLMSEINRDFDQLRVIARTTLSNYNATRDSNLRMLGR